jgi:hypothetical protein
MSIRTLRRTSLGLLLAPLLSAGCGRGPNLAPVQGRLLLDGKPLQNIQVTFIPDTNQNSFGPNSTGITDEDGHYELVCDDDDRRPGAVVGAHRITLIDLEAVTLPARAHRPPGMRPEAQEKGRREPPVGPDLSSHSNGVPKRRLPAVYMELAQTPLKKQVEPGSQMINLEVTTSGHIRGR